MFPSARQRMATLVGISLLAALTGATNGAPGDRFAPRGSASPSSQEIGVPTEAVLPTESESGLTRGPMASSFTVTAGGTANYRIPLWVPPGRNEVQPQLALHYDSSGGVGLLGVGWSLTGLSRITRCKKDFSNDGRAEPVQFDSSDPYCLDGDRLVPVSGSPGQDGAEYRTRHETFAKIVIKGSDQKGPIVFVSYQKDGRVFTYEADDPPSARSAIGVAGPNSDMAEVSPDGKYTLAATPVRYSWSLKIVEDRSGNTMSVDYAEFASALMPLITELVPTAIRYTGNVSVGNTFDPVRSVKFFYDSHPIPKVEYVSGLRLAHAARLRRIEMWGPGPLVNELLRLYEIGYRNDSTTGRSLLATVRECDGWPTVPAVPETAPTPMPTGYAPGVCKTPLVFEYERGTRNYRDIPTGITDVGSVPGGRSLLPPRLHVLDFNGDGNDDILYVPVGGNEYTLRLGNNDGFGSPISTGIRVPAYNERPYLFDFNLDDRTDLLTFDDCGLNPGCPVSNNVRVSNFNPLSNLWSLQLALALPNVELAEVADLDGDGRPDILTSDFTAEAKDLRTWQFRMNLGGTVAPPATVKDVLLDDHRLLDIDGDGAVELLSRAVGTSGFAQHYKALRLSGSNGVQSSIVTTLLADERYIFADLNGDGLIDAVAGGKSPNDGPSVVINSGNGFFPPVSQAIALDFSNPIKRVIDYTGAGVQDLLLRTKTAAHDDPMFVLHWQGDHFEVIPLPFVFQWEGDHQNERLVPFRSKWTNAEELDVFAVLDVNGDGLDDIVMLNDGQIHLYLRLGKKPDLLTTITDSLGAKINVIYEPLSNPDVYEAIHKSSYPVRVLTSRLWVVARHNQTDGVQSSHYRYTYTDGKADLRGQGFLGFASRTVTHVETGVVTTYSYDVDTVVAGIYPYLGLPVDVITIVPLKPGVDAVQTSHSELRARTDTTGQTVFAFAWRTLNRQKERRGGQTVYVRQVQTTQDFDEFGNLVARQELWGDNSREEYRARYITRPDEWLIQLLDLAERRSITASGQEAIRRVGYEYDTNGLLTRIVVEPGPKDASGYSPLGIQSDGVATLFFSLERYPDGLLKRVTEEDTTGPSGKKKVIQIEYDDAEHMFPVVSFNALGQRSRIAFYPGLGLPVVLEDANGLRSVIQYDRFGRLRSRNTPDGNSLLISYMPPCGSFPAGTSQVSHCIGRRLGTGAEALTAFDKFDRLVFERGLARDDGQAVVRDTRYDILGRVSGVSRPHFEGSPALYERFDYDNLGRLAKNYRIDGTILQFTYSRRETHAWNARGQERILVEDERERVIRSIEFESGHQIQTAYVYGPFDVLAGVGDPQGHKTFLRYDRLGRMTESSDRDGGHRTATYDAFGNLASESLGTNTIQYEVDALGRPTVITSPDGVTRFNWDTALNGIGNIESATSPSAVRTVFRYNNQGLPAGQAWEIDGRRYITRFDYDDFGRVSNVTYPQVGSVAPFRLRYVYGGHGELVSVVNPGGGLKYWANLGTDPTGEFGREVFGNGTVTLKEEDTARHGHLRRILVSDSAGNKVQELIFKWDANRNLQSRLDGVLKSKETFAYDSLDRLKGWDWSLSSTKQHVEWNYSPDGNIRGRSISGAAISNTHYGYGTTTTPHAVTQRGFQTFTYDAEGRQFSAPGRSLSYNSLGLPSSVSIGAKSTVFRYDAIGKRVVKRQGTNETLSLGGLYEKRTPVAGSETHHFFVRVKGRPVAQVTWTVSGGAIAESVRYLHPDHLGSVDTITDSMGAVVERLKFSPFGARVKPTAVNVAAQAPTVVFAGFAGHDHYDDLGLIDMGGRIYDPEIAHFLTPDPAIMDLASGQSLNPYSYVSNNPLSLVDPSGFAEEVAGEKTSPSFGLDWTPSQWSQCEADAACNAAHFVYLSPSPSNDEGLGPPAIQIQPPVRRESEAAWRLRVQAHDLALRAPLIDPIDFLNAGGPARYTFRGAKAGTGWLLRRVLSRVSRGRVGAAASHELAEAAKVAVPAVAEEAAVAAKQLGERVHTIYFVYGERGAETVTYIGRTSKFISRLVRQFARSGRELNPIFWDLTLDEARGVEQQLINLYGLETFGGVLTNKINSISPLSKPYEPLMKLGREILHTRGWPGF